MKSASNRRLRADSSSAVQQHSAGWEIYGSVAALQTIVDALPNPVFLKDRLHRIVLV